MLNTNQIKFLCKWAKIELNYCDGIPVGMFDVKEKYISYDYKQFKDAMGLEDIRLHWLLGNTNVIAGGHALNWIWQEDKAGDIDFFFKNLDTVSGFQAYIEKLGFKKIRQSSYAITYFEPEAQIILQVVTDEKFNFKSFDFELCKFCVSKDKVYVSTLAVKDLLSMSLNFTGNKGVGFKDRTLKYINKGFYLGSSMYENVKIKDKLDKGWFNAFKDYRSIL